VEKPPECKEFLSEIPGNKEKLDEPGGTINSLLRIGRRT
jgi:hypothetical protein